LTYADVGLQQQQPVFTVAADRCP